MQHSHLHPRPRRKLTVMVSLDAADSFRHMLDDEAETLRELAHARDRIAGPLLRKHHGALFKTMGDGGLIEFESVEDAVLFTLDFQDAMAARAATRANPLRFRAAVALADVLVEGEDRFGAAIGFLVHLQQIAPAGGVVITHSVRWQLARSVAAKFICAETRAIKGVDEPMEVWVMGSGELGDAPAPPPMSRDSNIVAFERRRRAAGMV